MAPFQPLLTPLRAREPFALNHITPLVNFPPEIPAARKNSARACIKGPDASLKTDAGEERERGDENPRAGVRSALGHFGSTNKRTRADAASVEREIYIYM